MTLAPNLFIAMGNRWLLSVPESLANEGPALLLQLLDHANVKSGISQAELQRKLDIKQARLSKLTAKLRSEGWIEDISQHDGDGRVRRIRTARKARAVIRAFEAAFQHLIPPPRRRRRETWRGEGPSLFTLLVSPPNSESVS